MELARTRKRVRFYSGKRKKR